MSVEITGLYFLISSKSEQVMTLLPFINDHNSRAQSNAIEDYGQNFTVSGGFRGEGVVVALNPS